MEISIKNRDVGNDLTEGSIFQKLIAFSTPIVLTNLIQQLYSTVDLAVIGKYVGSIGSVGVATGGELADMISPIAMGFSTAAQIYIAQLYGAKKEGKVKTTIGTTLSLMMAISFVCMILAIIFCKPLLAMMNCPTEALGQAESYMIITALGYPFIFGYNAVVGILRGLGESKRPLYFITAAAIINIFGDIYLVKYFQLEAAGTAIATVLSEFGSFYASFRFMQKNKERFDFELTRSYFKIDKPTAKVVTKLALPQVARSMLVRLSMLWVNSNVNSYGLTVSATNSIGNKIQKFLEVFSQSIDTAAAAMVGQNLGAKKTDRAGKTIWVTLAVSELLAAGCCVLCLCFPTQIYRLLTTDPEVTQLGIVYLRILCIHFLISSFTSTFQAMVTGCGYVSLGFILGILDGVVCRIGISLFFYYVLNDGYQSFWWGTVLARVLTGALCFAYFMSGKWKTRKLLSE